MNTRITSAPVQSAARQHASTVRSSTPMTGTGIRVREIQDRPDNEMPIRGAVFERVKPVMVGVPPDRIQQLVDQICGVEVL